MHAKIIQDAFLKAPVPDKFNDHNLEIRSFNPRNYPVIYAPGDKSQKKKSGSGFNNLGKSLVSETTGGLVDTTVIKDLPAEIENFFTANLTAQKLVAKWFNRDERGVFNMKLVGERGSYDATEMAANIAKQSVRGKALLADAGEELIGNTFVVVTRMKYMNKADIAKATKSLFSLAAQFGGTYGQLASQTVNTAADVMGKGYVVQTTSYLYRLHWNDSVSAVFYQNLWMDESNISPEKKAAFDSTELFTLDYIGTEKAWADIQSSIFTKKSEDDLICIATVKSVDAVIAKLQKEYDVFKTKTPLYTVDTLTAKIGLKEGIEAGDKFDVLEQVIDESGITKYERRGTIKVMKGKIWDNRYMAAETEEHKSDNPVLDRTYFKGGSNYYPGMLIRQIK